MLTHCTWAFQPVKSDRWSKATDSDQFCSNFSIFLILNINVPGFHFDVDYDDLNKSFLKASGLKHQRTAVDNFGF